MKFADQLRESAIPEWKNKYIDYKIGKKRLKYHYGQLPEDPLREQLLARREGPDHSDTDADDNDNDNDNYNRYTDGDSSGDDAASSRGGLELQLHQHSGGHGNSHSNDSNNDQDTADDDSVSLGSSRSISAASHLARLRRDTYNSRSNDSFNSLLRSSSSPVIPDLITGGAGTPNSINHKHHHHHHHHNANSRQNSRSGSPPGSNRKKNNNSRNRNNRGKSARAGAQSAAHPPMRKKEKIIYSTLQKAAIKDFIENWLIAVELTKCNDFYVWLLDECGTKFGTLKTQMHMYRMQKEKVFDPTSEEHSLNSHHGDAAAIEAAQTYGSTEEGTVVLDVPPQHVHNRRKNNGFVSDFKYFLKQNNLMPSWPKNAFQHKVIQEEAISRSSSGLSLSSMNNHPTYIHTNNGGGGGSSTNSNGRGNIREPSPTLSSILNPQKETFAYDLSLVSDEMTLPRAQRLLSEAIIEFYLFLQLVRAYRDLNVTGFRKMVKKFDKTLGTKEMPRFMKYARDNYSLFKHVNNNVKLMAQHMKRTSSFHVLTDLVPNNPKDDPLLWWETKAKDWYVTDLTNSVRDMKRNRDKLKKLNIQYTLNESMIHRNNRSTLQMTTAGLFIGFSFFIFLYTLYMSFTSPAVSYTRKILFPLWGGWYMTLIMLVLFQVNCFIWHRAGINYKFIMFGEVKTRSGTQMYNNDFATTGISLKLYYVSYYVLLTCICAFFSFKLQQLSPWSFASMASVFVLFFMPANFIPYWDKLIQTRNWLIITSIRLMCSGIFPVEFGDFFLGDIVCSLTYSIADIAMFACIYSTNEQGLCGSSHSKSMGILSSIPSYWRLLQCIRRFLDSGDWFPHLINAIKYSFGVGYQLTLCAYRLAPDHENRRTYFIIVSTMNSVLTSIWDLIIDWSLFQPSYRNLFLRDELYLAGKRSWEDGSYEPKRKALYYAAMVWDVLIRFQWVVYAVAPQTIQQSAKTSFILALTELLRRFIWVIFRIENEHVANVHLFRVTGDSPLPYPVLHSENPNDILQQAKKTQFLSRRNTVAEMAPIMEGTSTGMQRTSTNNDFDEPDAAYHTMARRNTTMFGKLTDAIPWVHATDFQRPVATPLNDPADNRTDADDHSAFESDTDYESAA
ncbi:Syg1 protein [Maudiozyma humilis]|uniref:Syg1 protein n=1 Tax=Maudiozyma humilis TaxID=51915 RepID=A0AAV5RW70_MAUHU|nr:Syg1 protein [Kazachstania humilis]